MQAIRTNIMKIIFISDLHLSPDTPEKNQLFFSLLSSWQGQIDALYILGDFFDYWLGDDDDNQFIREMRTQLHAFGQTTPIYFRGGNHDFALGKKFAKSANLTLISDLTTLKLGNEVILLSHGDTFCTLDLGYQKMKKILQHPLVVFILRKIPLSWRYKLKEQLENKSHSTTNTKPDYIYCVVDESIKQFANQKQATVVIHGHTHRPGKFVLNTDHDTQIIRYEIPDWQDHPAGGYLVYEQGEFKIVAAQHTEQSNHI